MMSADPTLALSVAYLRLNGYFILTEQELHIREPVGYRALTDIDILALRPPTAPGPPHHRLGQRVEECLIVNDIDPTLDVDTRRFDVIIGEVKTAEAELNPALLTPGALHATLRRTGDLYSIPLDQVVDELITKGTTITPTARIRLVVFAGHGREGRATTVHLGDAARFIRHHLKARHDLYRATRFSDPVIALLELLEKVR